MRPRNLEREDHIRIDSEPFSGMEFRVSDVVVEDIDITETLSVTLLNGEKEYAIIGATADSTFTVKRVDIEDGEGHTVFTQQIEVVE